MKLLPVIAESGWCMSLSIHARPNTQRERRIRLLEPDDHGFALRIDGNSRLLVGAD